MVTEPDYYSILQVAPHADSEVITAAFRRLANKYHPDKSKEPNATKRMQEINVAYEVLNDPLRRAAYDRRRAFRNANQQTYSTRPPEYNSRPQDSRQTSWAPPNASSSRSTAAASDPNAGKKSDIKSEVKVVIAIFVLIAFSIYGAVKLGKSYEAKAELARNANTAPHASEPYIPLNSKYITGTIELQLGPKETKEVVFPEKEEFFDGYCGASQNISYSWSVREPYPARPVVQFQYGKSPGPLTAFSVGSGVSGTGSTFVTNLATSEVMIEIKYSLSVPDRKLLPVTKLVGSFTPDMAPTPSPGILKSRVVGKMSQRLQSGDWVLTVENGGRYANIGNQLVSLMVTLENVGTEALPTTPIGFFLSDSKGKSVQSDPNYTSERFQCTWSLQPGHKVSDVVGFTVPAGSKGLVFGFWPNGDELEPIYVALD